MKKRSLLGTGLSGLVGSKVVSVLAEYESSNLDLSHPVHPTDITQLDQVLQAVESSDAEVLLHFAAFTDVNKAWEQRGNKDGIAYKVNVVGTQNMVEAAARTGKHLIHISTAYVFNGEKESSYTEQDPVTPIEWYGETKAIAEDVVQSSDASWTILRIDQPFRSDPFPRPDLVHKIIAGIQAGTLYPQFANHWIGPTFIDDFAKIVGWVAETKTNGVFHASSGEQWSDYQLASAVREVLKLDGKVEQGDLNEYLSKSQRPYQRNTALSTSRLNQVYPGKQMTIREAICHVTFERSAKQ